MRLAWCMIWTCCWLSCAPPPAIAAARLTEAGRVEMTPDDARLLLGEIRGLRAERAALSASLTDERGRTDTLAAQVEEIARALGDERAAREDLERALNGQVEALRQQVRDERSSGWRRSLLALVLGAGIGYAVSL